MSYYDYVIVGGGPSGLTLASLLSKYNNNNNDTNNKTVLILDKNDTIGGCHRVDRVNGLFTEHGPRIYSDGYINTKNILNEIGLSFDEIFTKYNFDISQIGGEGIQNFSLYEVWEFFKAYLYFLYDEKHFSKITVKQFIENFSDRSKDYIDRLCRLTDGAGADKYTMYKFLSLLNDNFFYKLYQPKTANDKGLFKKWKEYLQKQDVSIRLNQDVSKIDFIQNTVYTTLGQEYTYGKLILAIPPYHIYKLNVNNIFPNMGEDTVMNTKYINYIPIVFFWKDYIDFPEKHGFPKNEWGIVFIKISNYIGTESGYNTILSTCITYTNVKSKFLGKTAEECNETELKQEVFRQLKETLTVNLPEYENALLHSKLKYKDSQGFISEDTAFINTIETDSIEFQSPKYKNVYNLGTQNGKSSYNFTSMESAVMNAIYLYCILEDKKYKIQKGWKLKDGINIILLLLVAIVLLVYFIITIIKRK